METHLYQKVCKSNYYFSNNNGFAKKFNGNYLLLFYQILYIYNYEEKHNITTHYIS